MNKRLLIIEDDELLAATFQRFLKMVGYQVDVAGDYCGGRELLLNGSYDAVFMDINLPGRRTGMDLLQEIREIDIDTPVVIITGAPAVATAAAAVRNGAFDYLCKPVEKDQLIEIAAAAVRHKALSDEKGRQHRNLEAAFSRIRELVVDADLSDQSGPARNQADKDLAAKHKAALSERERQILSSLAQGETTSDIAGCFAISIRTVESYCARIIDKLHLDGMKALRRYAIRNKK